MLSHTLNRSKSWLLAHGEYNLNDHEIESLKAHVQQLLEGVPLPYILGQWEFYGRSFYVNPHVLIPRPETELLVERAIQFARTIRHPLIIDVGTGCGAIAISLSAELPAATIIASDISSAALKTAQLNATQQDQKQIHFVLSNLLSPIQTQFDLICANLPYIPNQIVDTLEVSNWEPRLALDGGQDGLDAIRLLLKQACSRISPEGVLLLEIEASLGKPALDAAMDAFPYSKCQIITDLAGKDRILKIKLG